MQGVDTNDFYCNNKRNKIHKLGLICQNRIVRFYKPDHPVYIDKSLGVESKRILQLSEVILQGDVLG
jgi:hypothetical protein